RWCSISESRLKMRARPRGRESLPMRHGTARLLVLGTGEVRHEHDESIGRRVTRIPRDELRVVLVDAELEGVAGIEVDDFHVGIDHVELAEMERPAAEVHVVARGL